MTPTYLRVSWELAQTFEDVLDYDLYVQRSESPEGPFDEIGQRMVDRYEFIDCAIDTETRATRLWYYRIRIVNRKTGETDYTEPHQQANRPELIAMELRRQAMLLYKQVHGTRCWLFPVRTFGQRCKSCFDASTGQQFKTRCPECYDTTWARGYLDPIEVWVQFEPTPRYQASNLIRAEKMQDQVAFMGHYPEVKPLDLLVEAGNTRWLVRQIKTAERFRAVVRQTLVMDEIEQGHINYEVPVNFDELAHSDPFNPFFFHPHRSLGLGIPWGS